MTVEERISSVLLADLICHGNYSALLVRSGIELAHVDWLEKDLRQKEAGSSLSAHLSSEIRPNAAAANSVKLPAHDPESWEENSRALT